MKRKKFVFCEKVPKFMLNNRISFTSLKEFCQYENIVTKGKNSQTALCKPLKDVAVLIKVSGTRDKSIGVDITIDNKGSEILV